MINEPNFMHKILIEGVWQTIVTGELKEHQVPGCDPCQYFHITARTQFPYDGDVWTLSDHISAFEDIQHIWGFGY
eukprot:9356318-Karenia_brevis.AAC.1